MARGITVTATIEISDKLAERLVEHCEDDETVGECIAELLSIYETQGTFLQEGPP